MGLYSGILRLSQMLLQFSEGSVDMFFIYDGGSRESTILGQYCSNTIPSSFISSSNEIFIQYYTDWFGSENGFHIHYITTSRSI